MTEADEVRDLLLKEYAEAGQISRQHEQLTRTSASVFVPTFIALAGYVLGSGASTSPTVGIALSDQDPADFEAVKATIIRELEEQGLRPG